MKLIKKICKICNGKFETTNKRKIYCSSFCNTEAGVKKYIVAKNAFNVKLYDRRIVKWSKYPDIDVMLEKRNAVLFGERE